MTGPGYDLLVVLHALSAVVGFGAVGVTGVYAASARSAPNPSRDAKLVRYFRPGTNWAERTMVMTPVLGAIVLAVGDHPAASQAWPWAGLGCWVVGGGRGGGGGGARGRDGLVLACREEDPGLAQWWWRLRRR
jgi:hypothetical protein